MALYLGEKSNNSPILSRFSIQHKIDENLYLINSKSTQKLLYIHTFSVKLPVRLINNYKYLLSKSTDKLFTLADKLKFYRCKNSLLQREVAEFAGISRSSYINLENGKSERISNKTLKLFAEVFGVEVDLLV